MGSKVRKKPRVVLVKEHRKNDGTKVVKHKRTKPDGIERNNHSYGKKGK